MEKIILIIEDNFVLNRMWDKRLTFDGFITKVFPNAEYALRYLESNKCDVVIVSFHSNEFSGEELVKVIREKLGNGQKIIGVFGTEDENIEEQAEKLGLKDYLRIPFWNGELSLRIRKLFMLINGVSLNYNKKTIVTSLVKINQQHEKIQNLLDSINKSWKKSKSSIKAEYLSNLTSTILEHFEAEKQFLKAIAYPLYDEHIEGHMEVLSEVAMLNQNFDSKNEVADYLKRFEDWFRKHEQVSDHKFFKYVRNHLKIEMNTEIEEKIESI